MQAVRKVYCGGAFVFDYQDKDYEVFAKDDYRANILGDFKLLLYNNKPIKLTDKIEYIGPFYFETNDMIGEDIVNIEKKMIEKCTDAIFLLDSGLCPGTISELIYASSLLKDIYIFYIKRKETEETESNLHSPCWYPILLCKTINKKTKVYSCESLEQAKEKIKQLLF